MYNDHQALYDYLVHEYNHHFDYWDWSYLDGRRVDVSPEPRPWDYSASIQAYARDVRSILDMRTGGGDLFATLLKQSSIPEAYATEAYLPNLTRARQLLEPFGATVFQVEGESLPLQDNTLELVINRHGSYDPREVSRVLKPGHCFVTQQVGDQTNLRIHELLGTRKQPTGHGEASTKTSWNLRHAVAELRAAGWHIVEQYEHFAITRFNDLGALVYYLKAIPWEVLDFSVERYFEHLVAAQDLFHSEGHLDVTFHTFFVVARKDDSL
ncbi:class I SAM-dependent methyltransferase [Ktedonospora formicarum]|uniref:Methyltransferase n=1 Tax=Ktedonospora formicarum TaxID=2778364 RepID=A0A8J3IC66_9CHLR|nr:class I SAM-dependent methyltransferase [Ktedonospora formicarum]GHO49608.1 methyltransferase [Ktedonospora formicarum]